MKINHILRQLIWKILFAILFTALYLAYIFKVKHLFSNSWGIRLKELVFLLTTLIVTYWIQTIFNVFIAWYKNNIAQRTKTEIDDKFLPLFAKGISLVIWIIFLIIILGYFGININALLATLGVGSLAVALAAQDTIANLIAGFLIMLDQPFLIGDTITLPSGEIVKVLDIGIRRSKFSDKEGKIIFVPNTMLSNNKIINHSYKA